MERKSGILCPIFSLPSKYGIGGFGSECFKFIDFLSEAKQKIWQILPLVQTGYGNSPYSSVSSRSFNPYFISVEELKKEKLITAEEAKFALCGDKKYIDYGELYSVRYPLLRKAFSRFDLQDKEFKRYVKSKESFDYAMFMAIKYASGQKHFYEWDEELKRRDEKALDKFYKTYREEVLFWQFVQFKAKTQWQKVKEYANEKGVSIMGDIPIYVALDSVDVWVNPELFKLDDDFKPLKVAGVPPDYFCQEGQLWGNPVYDYSEHKKNGYAWWIDRIKNVLSIYDYVRIDHFRAFDRYYEVESNAPNAINGEWIQVPSEEIFTALHKVVDKDRIVAEDLGIIDDGVRELLKKVGYPGMKILSFAFDGQADNLYLPQNIEENYICYTGTHDNDTLMGLIQGASEWDKNNLKYGVKNSLELLDIDGEVQSDLELMQSIIKLGFKSKARWFIMPMQDVCALSTDYRINAPATVKVQNWAIKLPKTAFSSQTKNLLKTLTKKYNRT